MQAYDSSLQDAHGGPPLVPIAECLNPPAQVRLWSMNATAEVKTAAGGLVVSNPGILGGKPVFRGTRLPVQALFDYLAEGLSLDYFLDTFEGVNREQAQVVS